MNLSISQSIYNNRTNYRQNVNFKLGGLYNKNPQFTLANMSPEEFSQFLKRIKNLSRAELTKLYNSCFSQDAIAQIIGKYTDSNQNPSILKSKKEIQEIIESKKEEIEREKNISSKTDKIEWMVEDCFIDKGDITETPWLSLRSAIRRNTPNAMQILTRILLADESRNKMVEDLVKEMAEELNRNREQYYTRTQSGTTQRKTGSNNPQSKAGWTKEQFVAHIFKVVTDKRFQLGNLKPSEKRNLAKLFGIEEEQVVKLDKHTYYELAKKYHPDTDDNASSNIFVILNILYEKSPNKS